MRTAYYEVLNRRARCFGWLEPEDFDRGLQELTKLRDHSSASCRGRRRLREEGGYPPLEVEDDALRFGASGDVRQLFLLIARTTPVHAADMLEAAHPRELAHLHENDLLPLLFHDEPIVRQKALHAIAYTQEGEGGRYDRVPEHESRQRGGR